MLIWHIFAAFVVLTVAPIVVASSIMGGFNADLRSLEQCVQMYQWEHGAYPTTDAESTWYEKIKSSKSFHSEFLHESPEGLPLDPIYHSPIILMLPTVPNEPPFLRVLGPNGVDDGGALDDWDSHRGPNMGYWYKKDWPGRQRQAIAATAATIVVMVTILVTVRNRRWALMLACVLGTQVLYMLAPLHAASTIYKPPTIQWQIFVFHALTLASALSVLNLVGYYVFLWLRPREVDPAICRGCGYDLRGTLAANRAECPECGLRVGSVPFRDRRAR